MPTPALTAFLRCKSHLIQRVMPLLLAIAVLASRADATSILGTVRDMGGKAVSGVTVLIQDSDRLAYSDSTGTFFFDSLAPRSFNLIFSHADYERLRRNDVYVPQGGIKRLEIELSPRVAQLQTMIVHGRATIKPADMPSGTKVLTGDEIMRAPGALMDVQRIVQNLPSVSSAADNVNEIIVRGGHPGENLMIMDNIELPNPNHFGEQSSGGGVISLINPLLVKKITFNAGIPPARYGGKASSVLDVELREANPYVWLGGIDIGVGRAGIHVEGPLWQNAGLLLSASRSYLDVIARFDPATAIPRYWGTQAKLSQKLPNGTLAFNALLGKNSIIIDDAITSLTQEYDRIEAGGFNYALGATAQRYLSEQLSASLTMSGVASSFDRLSYTPSRADTGFSNRSQESEQTLQGELRAEFATGLQLRSGAHFKRAAYTIDIRTTHDTLYSYSSTDSTMVVDSATGMAITPADPAANSDEAYRYGAYVAGVIPLFDRLELSAGVRLDGFSTTNELTLSPRLGLQLVLNEYLTLTAATGLQHQQPSALQLATHAANRTLPSVRVFGATTGAECEVAQTGIQCIAELYYKHYDNLTIDSARLGPWGRFQFYESFAQASHGQGRSYGLELFAQKQLTDTWFFSAAYSLSRAQSRFAGYGGGEWFDADYDFGKVLTLSGGAKFELAEKPWYRALKSKGWYRAASALMPFADRVELSARYRYLGGRPYTPLEHNETFRRWEYALEQPNAERFDPYHRLDLRFERRFGFNFAHLIYYIDLQNVYNHTNLWTRLYNDNRATSAEVKQLPFFPAGGIILGF